MSSEDDPEIEVPGSVPPTLNVPSALLRPPPPAASSRREIAGSLPPYAMTSPPNLLQQPADEAAQVLPSPTPSDEEASQVSEDGASTAGVVPYAFSTSTKHNADGAAAAANELLAADAVSSLSLSTAGAKGPAALVAMLCLLFPLKLFARSFIDGSNKFANISQLGDHLASSFPAQVKAIVGCTATVVPVATATILAAAQAFMDADNSMSDAASLAIMLYWFATHSLSSKKDTVKSVMLNYFHCLTEKDITALETQVREGTFVSSPSDLITPLHASPGYCRLDAQFEVKDGTIGSMKNKSYIHNLLKLFHIVIAAVTFRPKTGNEVNESLSKFIIGTSPPTKHSLSMREKESVANYLARQDAIFVDLHIALTAYQQPHRIPAPAVIAANYLNGLTYCRKPLKAQVKLTRDSMLLIDPSLRACGTDLSNPVHVRQLLIKSETILADKPSVFDDLTPNDSSTPPIKPKGNPKSVRFADQDKPRDGKPSAGSDSKKKGYSAEGLQASSLKAFADGKGVAMPALVGAPGAALIDLPPGIDHNNDVNYQKGRCLNCSDSVVEGSPTMPPSWPRHKMYPPHRAGQCPCHTRNGKPRQNASEHTPVLALYDASGQSTLASSVAMAALEVINEVAPPPPRIPIRFSQRVVPKDALQASAYANTSSQAPNIGLVALSAQSENPPQEIIEESLTTAESISQHDQSPFSGPSSTTPYANVVPRLPLTLQADRQSLVFGTLNDMPYPSPDASPAPAEPNTHANDNHSGEETAQRQYNDGLQPAVNVAASSDPLAPQQQWFLSRNETDSTRATVAPQSVTEDDLHEASASGASSDTPRVLERSINDPFCGFDTPVYPPFPRPAPTASVSAHALTTGGRHPLASPPPPSALSPDDGANVLGADASLSDPIYDEDEDWQPDIAERGNGEGYFYLELAELCHCLAVEPFAQPGYPGSHSYPNIWHRFPHYRYFHNVWSQISMFPDPDPTWTPMPAAHRCLCD